MSRTIAELTAGEKVYLDETIDGVLSHVPYIYLGQGESGNCIILREVAAIAKRMHSSNVAVYDGCEADLWLEDEESGYLSRFYTGWRVHASHGNCRNLLIAMDKYFSSQLSEIGYQLNIKEKQVIICQEQSQTSQQAQ